VFLNKEFLKRVNFSLTFRVAIFLKMDTITANNKNDNDNNKSDTTTTNSKTSSLLFLPLPLIANLRVVFLGAGYVGAPSAAIIAAKCPSVSVTVFDVSIPRIEAWNSSELPIYEPGLDDLIRHCKKQGNLRFSSQETDIAAADILIVCVQTPTKKFGVGSGLASDLKNVELAARMISRVCASSGGRPRHRIVVEKSTVPVKTAQTLKIVLNSSIAMSNRRPSFSGVTSSSSSSSSSSTTSSTSTTTALNTFSVISSPEFLAEGTAVSDLEEPSRVLIGGDDTIAGRESVRTLAAIYAQWVPLEKIITTNLWSSELSKLVANAFLAQRISSINSVSALCEASGADVNEVARAVGTDIRIGPHFLKSSVGFGGSCFKKDILNLVYLFRSYNLHEPALYWENVVTINDWQEKRFSHSIVSRLFNTITGKKLAMLGFSFKADTGDCRESPAAAVAHSLLQERARLHVFDPKAVSLNMFEELETSYQISPDTTPGLSELFIVETDAYAACLNAHAVIVCTEWKIFKTLDWARIYAGCIKPAFVFDGRNFLDHANLSAIGFSVHTIGKNLAIEAAIQAHAAAVTAVADRVSPQGSPQKKSSVNVGIEGLVGGKEGEDPDFKHFNDAVARVLDTTTVELPLPPSI
jgi:UDPglucose 6-dehydrogenase